jgi:hypothetical protein
MWTEDSKMTALDITQNRWRLVGLLAPWFVFLSNVAAQSVVARNDAATFTINQGDSVSGITITRNVLLNDDYDPTLPFVVLINAVDCDGATGSSGGTATMDSLGNVTFTTGPEFPLNPEVWDGSVDSACAVSYSLMQNGSTASAFLGIVGFLHKAPATPYTWSVIFDASANFILAGKIGSGNINITANRDPTDSSGNNLPAFKQQGTNNDPSGGAVGAGTFNCKESWTDVGTTTRDFINNTSKGDCEWGGIIVRIKALSLPLSVETFFIKNQPDGQKFSRRNYFDSPKGVAATLGGSINGILTITSTGTQ